MNNVNLLRNEISSLDDVLISLQSKMKGDDIASLIEKEFIGEYKRLLELIVENEELTEEKVNKLITVIQSLKELAKAKSALTSENLTKDEQLKLDELRKLIASSIDNIAASNYSIWAPTFNKLFFYSEITSWNLEVNRILPFINKSVDTSKPFTVVDIGTGTGFPSLLLARLYSNAKVVAFDNSDKMLEMAEKFEQIPVWDTNELTLTALMQKAINERGNPVKNPSKVKFIHSPLVTVEEGSVDVSLMATAIPSYTPFTQDLVKSIYKSLKPGGKAQINFSYMSLSRFILLWRDYGWKNARKEYKKNAVTDIIFETTEGNKKVFSFKISFPRKICEAILKDAGFKITKRQSIFPLLYLMLSLGRKAVRKDAEIVRAPYGYLEFPKNFFQSVYLKIITSLDNFLSRWAWFTAYELHFEVEKPI